MYHGDIFLGSTIDIKFTTRRFSTGAPFTLAGSPVVSAYIDNGTTQLTAGITLSVDFDSITGLNNVRVVTTAANGYTQDTNVTLVITTGTVDSVSVVGECIGSFSIWKRPVDVITFNGWNGTAATGTLSTTQATSDLSGLGDDIFNHRWVIYFIDGSAPEFESAVVTDYSSSTGLFTFAPALSTAPLNGDRFTLVPAATGLAVGDRTGSISGSVASVTGAVGSVTNSVTVGTNNDKTGYALSTAGIDAILDDQIGDSTITMRQSLKLLVATLGGKLSGAATATVTIRNAADTTNVVVASVDASGNRSAVTLTL